MIKLALLLVTLWIHGRYASIYSDSENQASINQVLKTPRIDQTFEHTPFTD